jgi:cold shock protein
MEAMAEMGTRLVSGTIKWFDTEKGYGFVEPADGGGDIFLHVSTLLESKFRQNLDYKGTPVCIRVADGPRGLQCTKIESMDLAQAGLLLEKKPTPKMSHEVANERGPELMEVKFFNRKNGYGFFARSHGPDVFIHMEILRACSLIGLAPGQKANVKFGENIHKHNQLVATHVEFL